MCATLPLLRSYQHRVSFTRASLTTVKAAMMAIPIMFWLEPERRLLQQFIKAQTKIAGYAITPLISLTLLWIIATPTL